MDQNQTNVETDKLQALIERAYNIKGNLEGLLLSRLEDEAPGPCIRIISRVKTGSSARKKIQLKRSNGQASYGCDDLTDLIGIRLICHFHADIVKAVQFMIQMIKSQCGFACLHEPARLYTTTAANQSALIELLKPIFEREELPFEVRDKESRYTSLHMTCKLKDHPNFNPVEIQIRNVFEDAWASIEHAASYKVESGINSSTTRHLAVLNSMVQTCIEYAEAIRIDLDGTDAAMTEVRSISSQDAELSKLAPHLQEIIRSISKMRTQGHHQEILQNASAFLKSNAKLAEEHPEGYYLLQMEAALSHIRLNDSERAIEIYKSLIETSGHASRQMIYFRMADAYGICSDWRQALVCLQKMADIPAPGTSSPREKEFLADYAPLKKSYCEWRLGEFSNAHKTMRTAYDSLRKGTPSDLRQRHLNSMIYFAIEERQSGTDNTHELRQHANEMRRLHMNSPETTIPEIVDTYAWLCFHIGETKHAKDAIASVLRCIDDRGTISHKGRSYNIPQHDLMAIMSHARHIMLAESHGDSK